MWCRPVIHPTGPNTYYMSLTRSHETNIVMSSGNLSYESNRLATHVSEPTNSHWTVWRTHQIMIVHRLVAPSLELELVFFVDQVPNSSNFDVDRLYIHH
jgi:hypothetical protein